MDVQYGLNHTSFKALREAVMPVLMPLMKSLLGPHAAVYDSGVIVNLAGSKPQNWHRDGEHLYPLPALPAYAYTVVVPLVTVTDKMGPTEIKVASHQWSREYAENDVDLIAKLDSAVPLASIGSLGAWDFRSLHRGLASAAGSPARPVVYFTVGKGWWIDRSNAFPTQSLWDGP